MKPLILLTILQFCYLAAAETDEFKEKVELLKNIEIPDIDDFAVIKEKCDKEGGSGTYDKFKTTATNLGTCFTTFMNVTHLKREVEESKKTGSMDEVFGKYCAKRSKFGTCIEDFINNLRHCLNEEEKKALNLTIDIVKQLGEFVCFKDGDRIAMFVAEGGVECIQSRTEGVQNCINSTFKITPNSVNTNQLPNLLIDKKKCDDLGKLRTCVVEELEKCTDSTPANIVDALFKFINRSACSNKVKRSTSFRRLLKRSVTAVNDYFNATEVNNQVETIFREKCSKNGPEVKFDTIQESFEAAKTCIKTKTKEKPIFATPIKEFKENLKTCTDKFAQKAQTCLPENEKYFPEFYQEIFLALVDFLYTNKDAMMKTSSRAELINCFQNFKDPEAKNEINKCFKRAESDNFDKEVVCQNLISFKKCITEQLQKRCIRDVTINQMAEGFFNALASPCGKN